MKIKADKWWHLLVCLAASADASLFAALLDGGVAASMFSGLAVGLALGIGKEYGDSRAEGNRWDWSDIIADSFGAILGCLFGLFALCRG